MRKFGFVLLLALGVSVRSAGAADHLDGAAVKLDSATDINDLYAWMSADGKKVNLAMMVSPAATAISKFSDKALYVFHTTSAGTSPTAIATDIICSFDNAAKQNVSCWVVTNGVNKDYVTGDSSATSGKESDSKQTKVFTGLRKDPFFFNLAGFNKMRELVRNSAGSLTFNASGCPVTDAGTRTLLKNQLQRDELGGAGKDFFATLNGLAIVLQVDTALVNTGGSSLTVWASTNNRPN